MSDTVPSTSRPSAPDPLIGVRVGSSYVIERQLGAGGMGKVYLARHDKLPRPAAVKVLQPEFARDASLYERFEREASIASSLGSQHIVQVFDFGRLPDGSPFMLMEFLQGRDVASYLSERRRLMPGDVVRILRQAVDGLAAAHERGVIHRDIKPANLFLSQEPGGAEVVKILDFGLSKITGASGTLTGSMAVGTPAYMSPEQINGSQELDARTDIYALAVTLYELLAGAPPYVHPSFVTLCHMIITTPPPSIAPHVPALALGLDRVFARALAKSAADRYGTVREFWADAAAVLSIEPEGPTASSIPAAVSTPAAASGPTFISRPPMPGQPSAPQPIPLVNPSAPEPSRPQTVRMGKSDPRPRPGDTLSDAAMAGMLPRREVPWALILSGLGLLGLVLGAMYLLRPAHPAEVAPAAPPEHAQATPEPKAPVPTAPAVAPTPTPTPMPAPPAVVAATPKASPPPVAAGPTPAPTPAGKHGHHPAAAHGTPKPAAGGNVLVGGDDL